MAKSLPLSLVLDRFIARCRHKGLAPATINTYKHYAYNHLIPSLWLKR